ncbi:hypothetical protein HWN40_03035 [Methanolobus zinderi]|jgi:hypothetical protein|uniref:Uncharacterized protein n=1 Tax=Methanolobus zinderi TaxID=536044 RepID=A0A7D5IAV8_9EURY|nr:hypothetical protein [Methanolobus zinderi]KXS41486.1 MAG: hypothetical protein AWU59_2084 [Methanolobus sp. T82-4]QLC49309.1 hypothetical protein HWN40_03035 [Methanolobus zinderi]
MAKKFKEDEERIENIRAEDTTAKSRREAIEDIENKEREDIERQNRK